jgi:hypothetical protein
MAINYFTLKKECALRSAQLEGTDTTSLENAYNTGSFINSLDGAEVPATSFKTVILNIEKELAHIIASDSSHPYRTFLYGESDPLANLASTPSTDSNNVEFIGVFDAVRDAASNIPCTIQPAQTIEDLNNTFFDDVEFYNYSIRGNRIQHTRTNVIMEGCVWDMTTQSAAYDADEDSPLPEELSNTWIAGVLANLSQVGWTDSAGMTPYFNQVYNQGIQILRLGSTGVPNVPLSSQNLGAG